MIRRSGRANFLLEDVRCGRNGPPRRGRRSFRGAKPSPSPCSSAERADLSCLPPHVRQAARGEEPCGATPPRRPKATGTVRPKALARAPLRYGAPCARGRLQPAVKQQLLGVDKMGCSCSDVATTHDAILKGSSGRIRADGVLGH
jgi:hypothetical protein